MKILTQSKQFALCSTFALLALAGVVACGGSSSPVEKPAFWSLLSKSEADVRALLGDAACEDIKQGKKCTYADPAEIEIVFSDGKANRITVNKISGVCNGRSIGIESSPDFKSPDGSTRRWNTSAAKMGASEISLFCVDAEKIDYAYIKVTAD